MNSLKTLVPLVGLTKQELKQTLHETHSTIASSFQLDEILKFIYKRGATSFEQITTLGKKDRISLSEHYSITSLGNVEEMLQSKKDLNTKKFLFSFPNPKYVPPLDGIVEPSETIACSQTNKITNEELMTSKPLVKNLKPFNKVEAVYIYHPPKQNEQFGRGTVCLSSQVGCSLSCAFCRTGTAPIERNLQANEIISQFLTIKHNLKDFPIYDEIKDEKERKRKLSTEKSLVNNIVFMGEGEPLYNFKNVRKACEILIDGFGISKRRIIISTSGVCNLIPTVVNELGVNLAISLHATTNEVRDHLVPLNKIFPIEVIMETLKEKCFKENTRYITFEYVMLHKVNDYPDDAKRLVELLKGIPCSVNLIAFNEWEGSGFKCSTKDRMYKFSQYLTENGINAPIRFSKGNDIEGACGQLKNRSEMKQSYIQRIQQQENNKIPKVNQ
ncbi:hypothetical protein ABK040_010830 [Willaertia magna]